MLVVRPWLFSASQDCILYVIYRTRPRLLPRCITLESFSSLFIFTFCFDDLHFVPCPPSAYPAAACKTR